MNTVFFNLRIDETLNDKLIQIAADEGRSKNKQIEYILKEYVKSYEKQNGTVMLYQKNERHEDNIR